jgi:hypothetical protein
MKKAAKTQKPVPRTGQEDPEEKCLDCQVKRQGR